MPVGNKKKVRDRNRELGEFIYFMKGIKDE